MKFGPVAVDVAEGATLAHTVRWEGGVLRKGTRLATAHLTALRGAGIAEVIAARLERGDVPEDEAARRVAAALLPHPEHQAIAPGPAMAGRVNLFAECAGVLRIERRFIEAVNAVDEAVTLATLPALARVDPRRMVATVKIIPYAVPVAVLEQVEQALAAPTPVLGVCPVVAQSAALILTQRPGSPPQRAEKGVQSVRTRLAALGISMAAPQRVAHETGPLAAAIRESRADLVLVLGDTATSDRNDVAAAAVREAGGTVVRFGMPVDPGNLLLLATLGARRVMILPGCARSPKLNGADWVLDRIACGLEVTAQDIAAMGVGGLLHEIPSRPQPRIGGTRRPDRPRVALLLLAAGMSRRMGATNKLLKDADGAPLVVRVARRLAAGPVAAMFAVIGHEAEAVGAALEAAQVPRLRLVRNDAFGEGIASSVRAGMAALGADTDAVIIALADMPGVGTEQLERLVGAYDPARGRSICRTTGPDGTPGHPVLFGRRYFETLAGLAGDRGARELIAENADETIDLPVGPQEVMDLDTEEDWLCWQQGKAPA